MKNGVLLAVALGQILAWGPACEDDGGHRVTAAALDKCRAGLKQIGRVPPDSKAASLNEACRDLIPPGPCRDAVAGLHGFPPDQKSARIATGCRSVACDGLKPPLPALCTVEPASLGHDRWMVAVEELRLAWMKQRICPRWKAGDAPQVCSLKDLPPPAADRARLMNEFFQADPDLRPDEFLQVGILPMLLVAHGVIVVRPPVTPGADPGP